MPFPFVLASVWLGQITSRRQPRILEKVEP